MKRTFSKPAACFFAAAFLCLSAGLLMALRLRAGAVPLCGAASNVAASCAAEGSQYEFRIESYQTRMDVQRDRTVLVEEEISAYFSGYESRGIIRDFPLDTGVRYQNIEAACSHRDFSPYFEQDDASFMSLYLRGDEFVRGQRRTYTITYTMLLPAAAEGYLPLDVLGFGWQCEIQNFSAQVTLPEGPKEYEVYSGSYGSKEDRLGVNVTQSGNFIALNASNIGDEEGITLDLQFADGVLTGNFDFSILYALLLGALLAGIALLIKFVFCRQPLFTTTVNLEAPNEMDPLLMGKLIDNKVDDEDLGALVFYLADKGCLTIDLKNEDDPLLRVTGKSLPAGAPGYIRVFYDGLFNLRESVGMSDLKQKFYSTAQSAKAGAELAAGQLYSKRSLALLILFGIVSSLLFGGFFLLYNLLFVATGYRYWVGFAAAAIAFAISAVGNSLAVQRMKKLKKGIYWLISVGACLLGLVPTLLFSLFPCAGAVVWSGFVCVFFSSLSGGIAGRFITRTREYSEKLGQILGFKQFILFTEKDKIEFMLKEDPALYYHILPYAQVLGVTDAWTDKFKGLDLKPPAYCEGPMFRLDVFDVILLNNVFRSMNAGFVRSFVSRPSSSGGGVHGGGFHGGGGGFGGGGFGGGGGRGC